MAALDWICANDVTKPVGRLTYTQLLNTRGGIEADLTVARLAEDRFYLVTGTGFRTHDLAWIDDHLRGAAQISDVTEDWGVLSLMGPKARAVLAACDRRRCVECRISRLAMCARSSSPGTGCGPCG